jgi:hypothetical protein
MATVSRSPSPMILLRISNGAYHMHRPFNDFLQAMHSAEAFAGAGFAVAMVSATGQFLMGFEPKVPRVSVPNRPAPKPCQYA